MRYVAFILLVLSVNACSRKISGAFIPKEYRYSEDRIGNGKLFVYRNSSNNQKENLSLKKITVNRQKYLVVKQFADGFTSDSLIIVNGKIIEEYLFFTNDDRQKVNKFKTTKDVIIRDGSKLGRNVIKRKFQDNETYTQMDIEERFLKDTSLMWQGKKLKCIVITLNSKIKIYKPGMNAQTFLSEGGQLYYAEGIGLIMWSVAITNEAIVKFYTSTYLEEIYNE
jgi:hypothetical protein